MALDTAALTDLRNYIKKRVNYLRYRAGGTYTDVPVLEAEVQSNGIVRIKADIAPEKAVKVDRIELYNNDGKRWAYQDVDITIGAGQGIMYWFDFIVKEGIFDA